MMAVRPDPGDIRTYGEYLDALRFVRALFDDPLPQDAPSFAWSETMAIALGAIVIEALRSAAGALGRSGDDEVGEYVGQVLDYLITNAIAGVTEGPAPW